MTTNVPGVLFLLLTLTSLPQAVAGFDAHDLDLGVAAHAFDHLGDLGDQAPTAVASGSTILYASGFGSSYQGLRPPGEMNAAAQAINAYLGQAKKSGIHIAFGYVCATSIVDLPHFDRNWSPAFRARFSSPPATWLQQDRDGKPLPSWYGGDYRPVCMNNPDWREYERYIVRLQLEAGFDGIFFDNPTVHPQGCYCPHCMKKFAAFLRGEEANLASPDASLAELRKLAVKRPEDFLRFRATIASDFLADMRRYARTIKPDALIICNNSLNSPDVLFRQCRTYGYNIFGLSKVEDLVVVEDMVSQPRLLANGKTSEYGPVYEVLKAVSHGKPIVAITLAEGDYHTPPNLIRLAMAEAAAHGASYLLWPTWSQEVRQKMITAVRPEADLLRENAALLNGAQPRADVVLFLSFRRWTVTQDCRVMQIAQALAAVNVPFKGVSEDDLNASLDPGKSQVLLLEAPSVLAGSESEHVKKFQADGGQVLAADKSDWLAQLQKLIRAPSVRVQGPSTVRVVIRDQPGRTIVHLLNLNVHRISSFQDSVTPAADLSLEIRLPRTTVKSVQAISADPEVTRGPLAFKATSDSHVTVVQVEIQRVVLSTILKIE